MRASKIICFAVGAMLAATAACADEISIVSNILGPEGPLYVEGNLYYVGWISHTLSKWPFDSPISPSLPIFQSS